MSIRQNNDEINTKLDRLDVTWEGLIQEAQTQIAAAKQQIARLRKSIRFS